MQYLLPKVERILEISRELNALKFGEFQLSSGAKSHYYFDGRLLTLHPDGAKAVAEVVLAITLEAGANFIACLLYTSPSPRDQRGSRMPSSA